jgi:hypothetical protein
MKKKLLIILTTLILLIVLYWNYRLDIEEYFFSKHVVFWSPNVELKYSDFQDESDKNSEFNVHYYYGLYLKANSIEKAYVRSYFDKDQSGIKDTKDSNIETEMKIQKLIFDLNEVYARKFNTEIDKIKFDKKTKFWDLDKIGKKIFSELDSKTDFIFHSNKTDSEILRIWRPKIDSLLVSYE